MESRRTTAGCRAVAPLTSSLRGLRAQQRPRLGVGLHALAQRIDQGRDRARGRIVQLDARSVNPQPEIGATLAQPSHPDVAIDLRLELL